MMFWFQHEINTLNILDKMCPFKKLKPLELIHSVKFQEISTQKSDTYLYTMNSLKKEVRKTVPFKIAPKRIMYLQINLTKEVKDSYNKNDKILMKKLNKTQINGYTSHVH